MPRIMQETKKYMRQDDAISVKINKKACTHTHTNVYMLDMQIYVNIYVKLKIIHQEVMVGL